jgi:hypothetical protein
MWQQQVFFDQSLLSAPGRRTAAGRHGDDPPVAMEMTHWVLHQGWYPACDCWRKAHVPAKQATGYGPRYRDAIKTYAFYSQ